VIFWILLAVAVLTVLTIFVVFYVSPKITYLRARKTNDRFAWDRSEFVQTGISLIATGVTFGIVVLILMGFVFSNQTGGVMTSEEKVTLTALKSGKEKLEGRVSGSIFLTSGYVSNNPVLSYISDRDGAFRSEWARADMSVVYQDEEDNPYVFEREYDFYSAWIVPWPIASEPRYEFHVPDGSVSTGYEVAP
jgi:hypothetical protein